MSKITQITNSMNSAIELISGIESDPNFSILDITAEVKVKNSDGNISHIPLIIYDGSDNVLFKSSASKSSYDELISLLDLTSRIELYMNYSVYSIFISKIVVLIRKTYKGIKIDPDNLYRANDINALFRKLELDYEVEEDFDKVDHYWKLRKLSNIN